MLTFLIFSFFGLSFHYSCIKVLHNSSITPGFNGFHVVFCDIEVLNADVVIFNNICLYACCPFFLCFV